MKRIGMMVALSALAAVLGGTTANRVEAQDVPTPFVVTVPININNFTYTPVTIPPGMRLVIDFISISGAAQATNGPVQPILLLNTQLGGGAGQLFYFAPSPSATVSGQYYFSEKTVIYADSLSVGPAFAGYTPNYMSFSLVISGHLIPLPADPPGPPLEPLRRPVPAPGIVAPGSGLPGVAARR